MNTVEKTIADIEPLEIKAFTCPDKALPAGWKFTGTAATEGLSAAHNHDHNDGIPTVFSGLNAAMIFANGETSTLYSPVIALYKAFLNEPVSTEVSRHSGYRCVLEEYFMQYTEQDLHIHFYRSRNGQDVGDTMEILQACSEAVSVWFRFPWFVRNAHRIAELLPQPSKSVAGLVAYYASARKRGQGVLTPIKAGKFLQKVFGDVASQEEIHMAAMAWIERYATPELKVTQDADTIEQLYKGAYNGSCMRFANNQYAGSEHPARVYAGPDLGVAYFGDAEECAGRCLVWPEKKIYFDKVYGDYHRLVASLHAAGYTSASEDEFYGARLQRIEYDDCFVAPYLDVCENVHDNGKWLVIDPEGSVEVRNTNGLSRCTPSHVCYDCGEGVDEEDFSVVTGRDGYERGVCDHCRERNYFFCDVMQEYHHDDNRVDSPDDIAMSQAAVDRDNAFFCDGSELNYPTSSYDYVLDGEGNTYESGWAGENCTRCAYSEELYLTEDMDTLEDGTMVWNHTAWLKRKPEYREWLAENGHVEFEEYLAQEVEAELTQLAA